MTRIECTCGNPTSGGYLCERCQTTFRWSLLNVAIHHADLETVATKRARQGGAPSKGSVGKTVPLPIDGRFAGRTALRGPRGHSQIGALAPGVQLEWDTRNTVVAWARTVMEEQLEIRGPVCRDSCLHRSCHATRRRRWPEDRISSMVFYLARQFRWIVGEGWSPVMLDEFLNLERRLARFVDRRPEAWYAGRCGATDDTGTCTAELYARQDRGWIDCPACGVRVDVGDRRDVLLNEAQEHLVTASQAAGALIAWTDYDGTEDKLVDRIRKWRDRERLEVRDVTSLHGRDRHLYRLGDIQALLIEHAQQRQETRMATA